MPQLFYTRRLLALSQRDVRVHAQAELQPQLETMAVFFPRDVNPAGATAERLLGTEDSRRFLKECSNLIIVDGCYRQTTVDTLGKTSEHLWIASHLCVHLIMPREKIDTKQAEVTKLNKICDTSSALVHCNSTSVETVKALVKNTGAFAFNDTLSSKYLPTRVWATSVQYIPFDKLCIESSALLPLLEMLSSEGGTGKNLGILHLD